MFPIRPKHFIFCFTGTFLGKKPNASVEGGGAKKLRQFFVKKIKFVEIMGTILWIKYLKRGEKNECPGAWETEDHFLALFMDEQTLQYLKDHKAQFGHKMEKNLKYPKQCK